MLRNVIWVVATHHCNAWVMIHPLFCFFADIFQTLGQTALVLFVQDQNFCVNYFSGINVIQKSEFSAALLFRACITCFVTKRSKKIDHIVIERCKWQKKDCCYFSANHHAAWFTKLLAIALAVLSIEQSTIECMLFCVASVYAQNFRRLSTHRTGCIGFLAPLANASRAIDVTTLQVFLLCMRVAGQTNCTTVHFFGRCTHFLEQVTLFANRRFVFLVRTREECQGKNCSCLLQKTTGFCA